MNASTPPRLAPHKPRTEARIAYSSNTSDRARLSALPASVRETLSQAGQPLDVATRDFMEARFGYDFGGVRIHTGGKAVESAQAVNALAYTVGRDVVFGAGQYEPGTSRGNRLIAHELAHTIQQNGAHALSPKGAAYPLIRSQSTARLSRLKDQSCKPPLHTSDEKIKCHIIENKPAASDPKAMEAWKKELRTIFEDVPADDAKRLHDRLSPGEKGDSLAQFFHAQVDTATRDEMLGILKKKFAAPTTPAAPSAPTSPKTPPASPTAPDLPKLYDFTLTKVRGATTSVLKLKDPTQGGTFIKGSENVMLDCQIKFDALIYLKATHVGRIFFRQYIMSLVRKEDACGRGPMGVEKGPALDTIEVYNHSAGGGYTGVVSATGVEDDVEMIDDDAPAQDAEPCEFKEGATVKLFAADKFRLYVMWEPKGGSPVSLGFKEWSWKAGALFNKMSGGIWTRLVTDEDGPKDLSSSIGTGDVPSTTDVIKPATIMDGKKSVPPF
ncbi:MAG: DUF4157 domain-containing protein [Acidobacteria bacterium]|nr:DUF4157 domain-containing protein [Acidobacteriota bacterium]